MATSLDGIKMAGEGPLILGEDTSEPMFGNVISFGELQTRLLKAFSELESILVSHSGPFATNCVIGSKWRQANDVDEFTKDGIKILKHLIVSEDPAGRFAARLARFVGIAVDKRCHDGTTTSMLLACKLAAIALQVMALPVDDLDRNRHSVYLEYTLNSCLNRLDYLKFTEDDLLRLCEENEIEASLTDIRGAIAYHMAMISSKGDADLSEKISYVVRSSPKKVYGLFQNTPLAIETEERYILKKQEFDLSMNAMIGIPQDYNYKNNTQYFTSNAVIFSTPNDIVSDSMESIFLQALISTDPRQRGNLSDFGMEKGWEELHGGVKNLVILTPMVNDANLISAIVAFNKINPKVKISWFNVQIHQRLRTSLDKTLHYMAGKNQFFDVMDEASDQSFIGLDRPVEIHLIGHILTIKGLYDRTGDVFHPFHDDPEAFPPYTKFKTDTEELIEFADKNISNPGLETEEVTYLTMLYRALTSQVIYDIEVGGTAHDQYANRTVYEDAIGAALSAVSEGVIFGGYGHLAVHCFSNQDYNPLMSKVGSVMIDLVSDSLRLKGDNSNLILSSHGDKLDFLVADIDRMKQGREDYVEQKSLSKFRLENFLKKDPDQPVLIQAFSGFHEQFKRFVDIIPKLALTAQFADMRIKDDENVR